MTTVLLVVVGIVAIAVLLVARRRAAAAVAGASVPAPLPPAAAPPLAATIRSEAPPPALAPATAATAGGPVGEAVALPGWPIPGEPGFFELGPPEPIVVTRDEARAAPAPAREERDWETDVAAFDPAIGYADPSATADRETTP